MARTTPAPPYRYTRPQLYSRPPSRTTRLHQAPSPERPRWQRVLRALLWVVLPVAAVGIGTSIGIMYAFTKVPAPTPPPRPQPITILAQDNREIARLVPEEGNRRDVKLSEIPQHVRQAVLAAEDKNFYEHGALSYRGIARAALSNLTGRGVGGGGSTITQQYVRNAFPYVGRERSLFRKIKEAIIAIKLEQNHTKDEIFEGYLNTIYFGRGAYGIEAAAQAYFGPPRKRELKVQELGIAQAAFLAGIIRSPEVYDEKENAASAKARRDTVLKAMVEQGWLGQDVLERARKLPIDGVYREQRGQRARNVAKEYRHVTLLVRQFLEEKLGEQAVELGGFTVRITIDHQMQVLARRAAENWLGNTRDPQVALVAIDPKTGRVLAYYGGRDSYRGKPDFNNYAAAMRQAGSTMKPFVLAEFLKRGHSLRSRIDGSAPLQLDTGEKVRNFDNRNYGMLDLTTATRLSVNTAYVRLIQQVGPKAVADLALACGMNDQVAPSDRVPVLDEVPTLALGSNSASTLQLASAFGCFANRGVHHEAYLVEWVRRDSDKGLLYRHAPDQGTRLLDERTADSVNAALSQVLGPGGTAGNAYPGRPAAGKTGTTNDNKDARFVGYLPEGPVASVWVGYRDFKQPLVNVRGVAQVTGGSFPALIWEEFMRSVIEHKQLPYQEFPAPDLSGVVLNPPPTTTLPPTTAPPMTTLPPTTAPVTTPPTISVPTTQPPGGGEGNSTTTTTQQQPPGLPGPSGRNGSG